LISFLPGIVNVLTSPVIAICPFRAHILLHADRTEQVNDQSQNEVEWADMAKRIF
jgi:hypothetical protein